MGDLSDGILGILDLQPHYSCSNTPEMRERWRLLSKVVRPAVERLRPEISTALSSYGEDLLIEQRDGTGRKIELPWLRFGSGKHSPSATEGYYVILHFNTDGSAVNIALGCGASRFEGGSYRLLSNERLNEQTRWMRDVIKEAFGSLAPFDAPPDFGARRRLPKSFERACAANVRIPRDEVEDRTLERLLLNAAHRLRAIYRAAEIGRDLSPSDQAEIEIARSIGSGSIQDGAQGYALSHPERRAIELKAMELASEYLKSAGYQVEDTSKTNSYDLLATKAGSHIKVEVKGTTSDFASAVLMTANEVALHKAEKGNTALIVCSKVRLDRTDGKITASGGQVEAMIPWDIDSWVEEPVAFRLRRPV